MDLTMNKTNKVIRRPSINVKIGRTASAPINSRFTVTNVLHENSFDSDWEMFFSLQPSRLREETLFSTEIRFKIHHQTLGMYCDEELGFHFHFSSCQWWWGADCDPLRSDSCNIERCPEQPQHPGGQGLRCWAGWTGETESEILPSPSSEKHSNQQSK